MWHFGLFLPWRGFLIRGYPRMKGAEVPLLARCCGSYANWHPHPHNALGIQGITSPHGLALDWAFMRNTASPFFQVVTPPDRLVPPQLVDTVKESHNQECERRGRLYGHSWDKHTDYTVIFKDSFIGHEVETRFHFASSHTKEATFLWAVHTNVVDTSLQPEKYPHS